MIRTYKTIPPPASLSNESLLIWSVADYAPDVKAMAIELIAWREFGKLLTWELEQEDL